jgi:hypothetical protein
MSIYTNNPDDKFSISFEDLREDIENNVENNVENNINEYNEINLDTLSVQDLEYLNNDNNNNNNTRRRPSVFKTIFNQQYCSNMSPIPSENENSDDEQDKDKYQGRKEGCPHKKFNKLTFKEVENEIEKYYNIDINDKYYTELDFLVTHVKGQKQLYNKSEYYTKYKLNFLKISSLLLSTLVTILTQNYSTYSWSNTTMTVFNYIVVFIISLINFLKLESSAEKYLQLATYYDSIEIDLEFANSKLLFITDEIEKREFISKKVNMFEKRMIENRKKNNILIPEEVKRMFPIICNVNILSFVKKNEFYKKTLIEKMRNVKNEIRFIIYKWGIDTENGEYNRENSENSETSVNKENSENKEMEKSKQENRLDHLYKVKNKLLDEIFEFRIIYELLDNVFMNEIRTAEISVFCLFSGFFKPSYLSKKNMKNVNPLILKHFISIGLVDE